MVFSGSYGPEFLMGIFSDFLLDVVRCDSLLASDWALFCWRPPVGDASAVTGQLDPCKAG